MTRPLIAAIAMALVAPAMGAAPASATEPPPSASTAPSWTVFGIELGKPVTLPTCQNKLLPSGRRMQSVYEDNPAQTCHEPDIQLLDAPWRRGAVNFPFVSIPLILSKPWGFTLIVDGKIEGLDFSTLSHGNTNGIITELSEKFGKPTSVSRDTATLSGISVPSVHAEWRLKGLYVSYRNIESSLDYGDLRIETTVMQAMRATWEKQKDEQRTKL